MINFSIILPVRNGGDYLKECVQSIFNQTYPHFNLLVLENGSTDDSLSWLNQQKDERLFVFPAEQSLTIEENWSRIKDLKKNEFITLIGHDDILHPYFLQEMIGLIEQHPEASLYQTQFNFIDSKGAFIRSCLPFAPKQTASELLSCMLTGKLDINGTGYVMRSADYDRIQGIPNYPNLLFADFELWINLSRVSYMVTLPKICFSYRLHQSMTAVSSDQKFQDAFSRFMEFIKDLKNTDIAFRRVVEMHLSGFISVYAKSFSHRLLRTPLEKRQGLTVNKWLSKCQTFADELLGEKNAPNISRFWSVRLSKLIDSSWVFRRTFLYFKHIFPRPILKSGRV